MPPPTKTLSPAELAKLEAAFATDPASQAYKPLAEAYLAMGRYMEAMVVCKKGVKAHPTLADPRVLLARVYADQGKDKKALEELQGALSVVPTDKGALRMQAQLQWKGGEKETARQTILKAFEADPADGDTQTAMRELGVEPPKPAAPPPPPPVSQPMPVQVAPANGVSSPSLIVETDVTVPNPLPAEAVAPRQSGAQQAQRRTAPSSSGRTSGARPAVRRPAFEPEESSVSEVSEISELSEASMPPKKRKKKDSGLAKALFFMLIFAVPAGAGAYYGIGQYRAKVKREVNKQVQGAQDLLKTDTFAAYKQACEQGEKALDLDPGSALAHRILAYAYVVRWGEHEHDDTIKGRAEEHLKDGQGSSEDKGLSYQYAAEALLSYYSGKTSEALRMMEDRVKAAEAENKKSALLYNTLGVLQMNQGDLERAKETLDKALAIAPDDPRVRVAMGTVQLRRGADSDASIQFAKALDYTKKSHPEALLGTAIALLDLPEPARRYKGAAEYLNTLLKAEPKHSPRQIAMGQMAKALLIARVSKDMGEYEEKFAKELGEATGVSTDPAKAGKDIDAAEKDAFGLDRTNPELNILKARRLFWTDKLDEAAAEVKKAIEVSSTTAQFHVELARVLLKKEGGEPQAEEALKKALTLVPGSPKLLTMLGTAQARQKKWEDARQTLEKATEDQKARNGEARFMLGRIYRDEKKDLKRAAELFDRAAADYYADPSLAAIAYDELGYTQEQAGLKDKARAGYEKALNASKEYAAAYCHYARFLAKENQPNDKDKIKAVAAEYLKLDPKGECVADMKGLAGQ
jgi:tetratricopeptide (TPR) repeat protein